MLYRCIKGARAYRTYSDGQSHTAFTIWVQNGPDDAVRHTHVLHCLDDVCSCWHLACVPVITSHDTIPELSAVML
jgi:hypothetical protein